MMRWLLVLALCGCSSGGGDGDGGQTSGDGGSAADSPSGGSGAEQVCVDTINMYRATLGLPPYVRWTSEEMCASGQAASDSMTMKAHGAFGMCSESAQNECPGWPGPPETMIKNCLAQMWAEGPGTDFSTHGHWINMSSKTYTKVACGFHQTQTGSWWSVQDFK